MIRLETDPFPADDDLSMLWQAAWGTPLRAEYVDNVLGRSLVHGGAYEGDRLVGLVNVAWAGGVLSFLLYTPVHPAFQRQRVALSLVRRAAEIARERGAHWLHVDFEPHLEGFYRACGFQPTGAGLIDLK